MHLTHSQAEKQAVLADWTRPLPFEPGYASLIAPPAVVDRSTSRAAARSVAQGGAQTNRRRVFTAIIDAGNFGRTDEELQIELRLSGNSERPARVWVTREGLVQDSGRRRLTASGRQAVVWIIVPEGER